MNLFLHGASDFNVMQGDTLRDPKNSSRWLSLNSVVLCMQTPFSLENGEQQNKVQINISANIYGTPVIVVVTMRGFSI